jgi:hypothetical protein
METKDFERRMLSSGTLRLVALVRTDVSEERRASFIRVFLRSVHRLLMTASVVPSSPILVTLMVEALSSSETSVFTRATRRNIPEDTSLHSHRRENLKSYILRDFAIVMPNLPLYIKCLIFSIRFVDL